MFIKFILGILITGLALPQPSGIIVKGISASVSPGWQKSNQLAIEPIITSPAAVIIDADSGQILYKKNQDEPRSVASITKLFTSYLYLQQTDADLERQITLQGSDERNGGQRYVYRGETGTAFDFLNLALIPSDNSAAVALARAGGFSDNYAEIAASTLKNLGLVNTKFSEPSGLDNQDMSTAYEIAQLGRQIFKRQELASIVNQPSYAFKPLNSDYTRQIPSTNDLLTSDLFEVTAGKTGYTTEAGYCLVLKAAGKSGKELLIAVLGAPSSDARFQDAKILMWWAMQNFK